MIENYISVEFEDEQELLTSIKVIKDKGFKIYDVFTPFDVHGLDKALKIKPSKIPIVGFIAGSIGAISSFFFQFWISAIDWPLNIGGKPFFAAPSFIPVTFEMTVLFAVLGMIIAFLFKSNLYPGSKNKIYHDRITDDNFVIILDYNKNISDEKKLEIEQLLFKTGAHNIDFVEDNPNKRNR